MHKVDSLSPMSQQSMNLDKLRAWCIKGSISLVVAAILGAALQQQNNQNIDQIKTSVPLSESMPNGPFTLLLNNIQQCSGESPIKLHNTHDVSPNIDFPALVDALDNAKPNLDQVGEQCGNADYHNGICYTASGVLAGENNSLWYWGDGQYTLIPNNEGQYLAACTSDYCIVAVKSQDGNKHFIACKKGDSAALTAAFEAIDGCAVDSYPDIK